MTLDTLITRFVTHLGALVSAGQIRASTGEWYVHQLSKLHHLGARPAAAFALDDLGGLRLTHHLTRAIRRLIRFGVESDLIQRDRFRGLRVPRCGQRTRTVTDDEFRRIAAASPAPFRRMLHMLRETAARPGELRALLWSQVDLSRRVITLTDFKSRERRRDGAAVRVIPLNRRAVVLLRWMQRQSEGPTVFTNARGRAWSSNALRCAMRRARTRAGIEAGPERVVCYSLRHTRATELIRGGTALVTVGEVLGHTETTMTRRYVHLHTEDLLAALDSADGKRKTRSICPASK